MAAVAAVLDALPVGAMLAVPEDPYHGVEGLVAAGEEQGRWEVTRIDLADTAAWRQAAMTSDLLWLESPANPLITSWPYILCKPCSRVTGRASQSGATARRAMLRQASDVIDLTGMN